MPNRDALTDQIIGCAIQVHRTLGPGLLESAYEHCLAQELSLQRLSFERQVPLPIEYKGVELECGYRIDLLVEDQVVLELKAVETVLGVHKAQLLSYLKLSGKRTGLLLNFHVELLKHGITRLVL